MIFEDTTGQRWLKIKIFLSMALFTFLIALSLYGLNHFKIIHLPLINVITTNFVTVIKKIFIYYLFITIILSFLRMLIIIFFCFRQQRRKKILQEYYAINKPYLKLFRPRVSVIVPVYNEEVIIRRTIKALLKSDYPLTEILVIDDGSKDRTAYIIKKYFFHTPKVKLVQKENGGKASALNLGFQKALGDIIITSDADTIFTPTAISELVKNFSDSRVAAVTGNCKIGNMHNQLLIWQHIEFVTTQNLDKRAFEELDCITVVSGSNSAWRKSVIEQLGYFHHDTLAEDTELTIRILNAGHKIMYDDRAISYEESPETIKEFVKQRYRWSYGILQAAWKHKKSIHISRNKPLKYFAIPSLLFSYLLFLTAPIIDILFILAILTGSTSIYLFALLFYFTDTLNSFIAFKIEKEKMKPLLWIFLQRFGYRYLLGYVTWKALIAAIRGNHVRWDPLKRTGNNNYK
ncbi:glycosyltransferase family 2 protein [Solibacillus sp. MA9]|uniref:Glycosyltransferase family 2 protein n=1 Tax=Solibacillus palustris TaxID=2908203 RepID=A0ABS9UBK1_9BACL|nr:glycosyltransferase [Solibacillus sp. MA9]MCH7321355.1 glycosyltransferase family 2 protein [Solibacillus sp. MA9]